MYMHFSIHFRDLFIPKGGVMSTSKKSIISMILVLCMFLTIGFSMPIQAAADTGIAKVLTTISASPVALMDPSIITASTSTEGCHVESLAFYDPAGNLSGRVFNVETYRMEMILRADSGYKFNPDVACYLNNSSVNGTVSADGSTLTISREYSASVWAPTIYKHPGGETVNEGSWATFVVSATYVRDYQWLLRNPNETEYVLISNLQSRFPSMTAQGDGTAKLYLYNIPYELNGWKVVCDFVGAGAGNVVSSNPAVITVIPDPSRQPASPEPTAPEETEPVAEPAETEPSASPEVTSEPEPTPTPSAVPATTPNVEEPVVSELWTFDSDKHWHDTSAGTRVDEAGHSFSWTTVKEATSKAEGQEEGVCDVCGYTASRAIPVVPKEPTSPALRSLILKAVLAVVLLLILAAVVFLILSSRKQGAHSKKKR